MENNRDGVLIINNGHTAFGISAISLDDKLISYYYCYMYSLNHKSVRPFDFDLTLQRDTHFEYHRYPIAYCISH